MRIIGHGIDLVTAARVTQSLAAARDEFLDGWFHLEEQMSPPSPSREAEYYAGRIAVKEAVAKALGTGFGDDISWTDVRVITDERGAVGVHLAEGARDRAEALGIERWFVSISHTEQLAIGSAIATSEN
jgi:holo-[acyl-carrier protein] synthase